MKIRGKKAIIAIAAAAIIVGAGAYVIHAAFASKETAAGQGTGGELDEATFTPEEASSKYVRFDMEAYDTIRKDYWASTTEAQLANFFQLSLQKALGTPVVPFLKTDDRTGTAEMLATAFASATSTEERRAIAVGTLQVVLYNLPPVGHAELLSKTEEVAFRQKISNVNASHDLYQSLGIPDGSSAGAVKKAYQAKEAELAGETSTTSKAALAAAAYADKVLSNPNTKDLYDSGKVEPTLWSRVMGRTLYINLTKVSPTSLIEFARAVDSASTTPGLDGMIIDLRGNIGGALDFAQAFLGLFLGPNQYAFDLFHQGAYDPQRTTEGYFPDLARYREIVVLTDGMTQSTAEVTTAAMKRFKLATVVGAKTRGWGTVENTFPIETQIDPTQSYAMLLVHSLTLGADEQPIQDNGVKPDVDISDKNWRTELSAKLSSQSLIDAVERVVSGPPLE